MTPNSGPDFEPHSPFVRSWQTGQVKEEQEVHGGQINDIRFSADGTHFVTASADMTSKLIDTQSLEARSHIGLGRDPRASPWPRPCWLDVRHCARHGARICSAGVDVDA